MLEIRQGSAVTLQVGPFLDISDGNTELPGLTINQADILLSKIGAAYAQKTEATPAAHSDGGMYTVLLDTTDTATLGRLQLKVHVTGALYVFHDFLVVSQDYYDAKYGPNLDAFKADVSALATQASVDGIPTNPLLTNDVRLDNLDATITSRASQVSVDNLNPATVADFMTYPIEGAITFEQLQRIISAACAGVSTGGGTTFRDLNNTTNRIVSSVDVNNNRTVVVVDGT